MMCNAASPGSSSAFAGARFDFPDAVESAAVFAARHLHRFLPAAFPPRRPGIRDRRRRLARRGSRAAQRRARIARILHEDQPVRFRMRDAECHISTPERLQPLSRIGDLRKRHECLQQLRITFRAQRLRDLIAAREVKVQRGGRILDGLRNLAHGQRGKTFAHDDAPRCIEDALTQRLFLTAFSFDDSHDEHFQVDKLKSQIKLNTVY